MFWQMPWLRKKDANVAPNTLLLVPDYFSDLARRALAETWKRAISNPLFSVLVSLAATGLAIFTQWRLGLMPFKEMTTALIGLLFVIGSLAALFIAVLLIHFFYLTPKHLYAEQIEKTLEAESKFRSENDLAEQRRKTRRDEMYAGCAKMLKAQQVGMLPFHAIARYDAYKLGNIEDLTWLCDELAKFHGHPFAGLENYVPTHERLEFLRWMDLYTDYTSHEGVDYLDAAEQWRQEHNHPEPPGEDRVTRLFNKKYPA